MKDMSKMQQQVYNCIAEGIRRNGYAPSVREIADTLGLKSPSTVQFHIKHLKELGYLHREKGKGRAISLTNNTSGADNKFRAFLLSADPEQHFLVPILRSAATPELILSQRNVEDYLIFDASNYPGTCFALRMREDSMIGLGILPDDLLIIHQQRDASDGDIVLALLEGDTTVKTLSHANGEIRLLPANPTYPPLNATDCTILGRVITVVRNYDQPR